MKVHLKSAGLASLLAIGVAWSAAAETTLKFAHAAPDTDLQQNLAVFLQEQVAERTGGEVKVQIFPQGQLGNDQQMIDGARSGIIDIVMVGLNNYAGLMPEVAAFELPFSFTDRAIAYRILDGEIGQGVLEKMDRSHLDADLVVMGVGVRPRTDLAEQAGLRIDRGVVVDAYLETDEPGIFAAGDIARFPYALAGGGSVRIEHWVVAERQGQIAAMNMLGHREKYEQAPYFWGQHYDVPIHYVGHAEAWDSTETVGDISARDGLVRYREDGRVVAVASIFRDKQSLLAELDLEDST
jgi:Bacterial extracellular solute-binding protein, family 7/Pyridine nucleotide-disulphide oxidoreductase